jgi:hypothetical protein
MHYIGLSFDFGELTNWAQIASNNTFDGIIFGQALPEVSE